MIPVEIIRIAAEATSEHNDGWAKELCRKQLEQIRNYINGILDIVAYRTSVSPSQGEQSVSTGGKP